MLSAAVVAMLVLAFLLIAGASLWMVSRLWRGAEPATLGEPPVREG